MAVEISLLCLALGLGTLVWGTYADASRKAMHFGVGVTFVGMAVIAVVMFAIRSLWLYPLS